jgi:hypothetical protein
MSMLLASPPYKRELCFVRLLATRHRAIAQPYATLTIMFRTPIIFAFAALVAVVAATPSYYSRYVLLRVGPNPTPRADTRACRRDVQLQVAARQFEGIYAGIEADVTLIFDDLDGAGAL